MRTQYYVVQTSLYLYITNSYMWWESNLWIARLPFTFFVPYFPFSLLSFISCLHRFPSHFLMFSTLFCQLFLFSCSFFVSCFFIYHFLLNIFAATHHYLHLLLNYIRFLFSLILLLSFPFLGFVYRCNWLINLILSPGSQRGVFFTYSLTFLLSTN